MTLGDDVVTLDVAGTLGELRVAGGIAALGKGSDAVHTNSDIGGLEAITVAAKDGHMIVPRATAGTSKDRELARPR